ncbi:MAG: DUF4363 family protein [Clostridia bacterium]|nr:DUF4363 family protein [Clostridia bacterium]
MKSKIAAVIILIGLLVGVIANALYLDKTISKITSDVESFVIGEDDADNAARAREMFDNFKEKETYISTTVNHNDLTEIESLMSELVACLSVGMRDDGKAIKSRLIDALGHLRRLSGVNIDSII